MVRVCAEAAAAVPAETEESGTGVSAREAEREGEAGGAPRIWAVRQGAEAREAKPEQRFFCRRRTGVIRRLWEVRRRAEAREAAGAREAVRILGRLFRLERIVRLGFRLV